MKQQARWFVIAMSLIAAAPAWAQPTEHHPSDNAAGVLNSLPPDLHKKLQQLSQLIDRNIKTDTLTEEQVKNPALPGGAF